MSQVVFNCASIPSGHYDNCIHGMRRPNYVRCATCAAGNSSQSVGSATIHNRRAFRFTFPLWKRTLNAVPGRVFQRRVGQRSRFNKIRSIDLAVNHRWRLYRIALRWFESVFRGRVLERSVWFGSWFLIPAVSCRGPIVGDPFSLCLSGKGCAGNIAGGLLAE